MLSKGLYGRVIREEGGILIARIEALLERILYIKSVKSLLNNEKKSKHKSTEKIFLKKKKLLNIGIFP